MAVILVQQAVIEVHIVHSHAAARDGLARLNGCQHGALGVVGADALPAVIAGLVVIIEQKQVDFVPVAVAERHVAVAPRGAGGAVVGTAGQAANGAGVSGLLVDGIDQRAAHRVGVVDFPIVERLVIHTVCGGGQHPQCSAADALRRFGGGRRGLRCFRGCGQCRCAVRRGMAAGSQDQRQGGSDGKVLFHDVSSPYCVFSAAKVCGVMLAAESVTLYPLAFATA